MNAGILLAITSAFFSSAKDIVSKKLSFTVGATISTFASFLFALPYYTVLLIVFWMLGLEPLRFGPTFFLYVVLRSLTDTGAELCKMHAFKHADISLVVPVFALYPLFLLVTSPLITGDPLPFAGVIAVVMIAFGSIILVYKPGTKFARSQVKGILLASAAAFFFALNTCFDRLAVQESSPLLAGFAMTALSAAFLYPLVHRQKRLNAELRAQAAPFFSRGFFEVGFMVTKLAALQTLQAPYVVGIQKISLLLSIFGGRLIFKEEDFIRRLIAGIMVFGGVVLIVFLD